VPNSLPPRKTPFSQRREREFLYLLEVDALIAALEQTRSPIRNQALAILLFCQALQPIELCWLRWRDLDFAENILRVERIRSKPIRYQPQAQATVNLQLLCPAEIDIVQQLHEQHTTDWIFSSERKQRLSERSLHHIIQQAGEVADILYPVHPYMLRRTGLYYRAALLLQPIGLSLRQCCLLWNWHGTKVGFSQEEEQELSAISQLQAENFLAALKQLKEFTGIGGYENVIDYLLGAYSLFPRLQGIPQDYWYAPPRWSI
jgi:type 1 fimbriae regulatory protein FimB